MMLFLLNGDYRITEESHNYDVGQLWNWTLCSVEGVNSEKYWENWVKYAIIKYIININSILVDDLHTTAEKDDIQVENGK